MADISKTVTVNVSADRWDALRSSWDSIYSEEPTILRVMEARQDGTVGLAVKGPDGVEIEIYCIFPDLVRAVMAATSEEG